MVNMHLCAAAGIYLFIHYQAGWSLVKLFVSFKKSILQDVSVRLPIRPMLTTPDRGL